MWLWAAMLVNLEVLSCVIGVSSWSIEISLAIEHVSSWIFGDDVQVVSVDLLLLLLLLSDHNLLRARAAPMAAAETSLNCVISLTPLHPDQPARKADRSTRCFMGSLFR